MAKRNKRDEQSSYLFFKQRNPKSNWSKINRDRVAVLIQQGLMTEAGQVFIDLAKSSGTWELLADVQNNIIPDDMQKLFDQNEIAFNNFQSFSPSSKRIILEWIVKAKKAETREKRMVQTVELAARNIKANH
ncbi:YdeI/OmpD-associated family protein [Pedobacter sp. NJ-S-72]